MLTVIGRYINREVFFSWLAVTAALVVILMSHRFARFLGRAASGEISTEAVWSLLGLSTVQYLVIILPIAFFLAILLALGRFYKDSEMAAMMACGVGPMHLYRALVWLIVPVVIIVGLLSLFAAPAASQAINRVQQEARAEARLGLFEPGAFRQVRGSDAVFYAERREGDYLHGVFIQGREDDRQVLVRARRARVATQADDTRYLVLEDGFRYELVPGEAEMQRTRFDRHGIQLPDADEPAPSYRREALPTRVLLASGEPADYAELHWRLAMPLGGLFLALVAVPLARTSPRQGRYGRLFLGIVVYLIYSNLLATGQVWIERGQVPPPLGLWWCHGLLLAATLGLLFAQTGGWRRWMARRDGRGDRDDHS